MTTSSGAARVSDATVFLSYSRSDRNYVSRLANWLGGHGVRVWFDHAIDHGLKWKSEIISHLDHSSTVIVVMTASARDSEWVDREVRRARRRHIPVLPLMLELNQVLDCVADLQFENVATGQMPGLRFCERLPGFLVSEQDLANALTDDEKAIVQRIRSNNGACRRGMSGPMVAAIQAELMRVGLDPGPIDGEFGPKTERAVREFQNRRCNVAVSDGIVGALTLMILVHSSMGDLARRST
jgi:TIR domain-containing protein/putative peptidoglycan binding protein